MVVLFFTFVNCQKENSIEETITEHINKPNLKAYIVQADSIFKIHPKLKRIITQRFSNKSDNFYKNITSSTYGFSIDTTRVQLLVAESYETYTFVVTRDGYNENILENYVLTLFDNGTYIQMLVSYPFTISENVVSYDILNAYGQYINDTDLLTSNRGPMCGWSGDEVIAWDENAGDCVDFPCGGNTGNGNHMPGQACDATGIDRARTECTGAWVPISCISSNIDNDGGNNGVLPGGGPVLDQDGNPIEHIPIITLEPDYSQPILECLFGGPQMGGDPTEGQEVSAALDNLSSGTLLLIQSYLLLQNQCSEEAKAFTKAIALAGPDAEVDWEEGIIFDNTWEDFPCHRSIVHNTIGVCSPLTGLVQSVFENNDFVNLILSQSTSVPEEYVAITNGFGQYTSLNSYNVEITFRKSFLEDATDLSIACATIHESLHAIFVYMYEEGLLLSDDGTPLEEYEDYVLAYINFLHENENTNEDPAHELLAEFVGDIATSLSLYGQNAGYNYSYSYYYNLSWAGLTHTNLFDELYPIYLPGTSNLNLERLKINNAIVAEQDNETQNYQANGTTYQIIPKGITPNENEPCD